MLYRRCTMAEPLIVDNSDGAAVSADNRVQAGGRYFDYRKFALKLRTLRIWQRYVTG